MPINIVLVEPEIPQNTGNISRTCAVTGSKLHLIKPLGFTIDDNRLKRAGLDYWDELNLEYHESLEDFFLKYPQGDFYFATTKGDRIYSKVNFNENSFVFFGKETAGLPDSLLKKYHDRKIKIPMKASVRSLNLSNSVAVILYEALRQLDFPL